MTKEKEIKCNVTLIFKKVKFNPSVEFNNDGRCLKCEAIEFCGCGFTCPCNMDEQLIVTQYLVK
jgi:hypothetical protein